MKLPEKRYYFLDEVAEQLGCKIQDLIHYGGEGLLLISTEIDIPYKKKMAARDSDRVIKGLCGGVEVRLSKEDLHFLDMNRDSDELLVRTIYPDPFLIAHMFLPFGEKLDINEWQGAYDFLDGIPIPVKKTRLYITRDDLNEFTNCRETIADISGETAETEDKESPLPPPDLTILASQYRAEGLSDGEIAYLLIKDFGKSSTYSHENLSRIPALSIGMAVFPKLKATTKKEKDALEGRVWKACKKFSKK